MAYDHPPNTKFAAIHISRCSADALPETLALDRGLSAHNAAVVALDRIDRDQFGAARIEAFERTNLVLMASTTSQTPGARDHEMLISTIARTCFSAVS